MRVFTLCDVDRSVRVFTLCDVGRSMRVFTLCDVDRYMRVFTITLCDVDRSMRVFIITLFDVDRSMWVLTLAGSGVEKWPGKTPSHQLSTSQLPWQLPTNGGKLAKITSCTTIQKLLPSCCNSKWR